MERTRVFHHVGIDLYGLVLKEYDNAGVFNDLRCNSVGSIVC